MQLEIFDPLTGFEKSLVFSQIPSFVLLNLIIKPLCFQKKTTSEFVWIFVLLLPLGLLNIYELQIENIQLESRWWFLIEMIPLSVLVSWVFVIMEKIGSNSEDPFEGRMSDVPMNALCRTIEIDLKDMLDETNLPIAISPKDNILY